jgi:hypothetical protein
LVAKETNYALRADMTEAGYQRLRTITSTCLFWNECSQNKQGYDFETVLNNGMRAINVKDLETVAEDTDFNLRYRNNRDFARDLFLNP